MAKEKQGYVLIDPPVGPYHPVGEIRAWIKQLQGMERNEQVSDALEEARHWLKRAREG